MSKSSAKNYRDQGGDKWVVGGTLDVPGKLLLTAPNGDKYEVKVSNAGELSASKVT